MAITAYMDKKIICVAVVLEIVKCLSGWSIVAHVLILSEVVMIVNMYPCVFMLTDTFLDAEWSIMEERPKGLTGIVKFCRTNNRFQWLILILLGIGLGLYYLSNLSFNNPSFEEVATTPGSVIATLDDSQFISEVNYEYVDDELNRVTLRCIQNFPEQYNCSSFNDAIKFEFRGKPFTANNTNWQVVIKNPLLTANGTNNEMGCWQHNKAFLCMDAEKRSQIQEDNKK